VDEFIDTLYGNDEITNRTLKVFDSTQNTIEGCIGKDEVAIHVTHQLVWNGLLELKQRGVKIRIITQVTSDNLSFCREFSRAVELRHVNGIQSSFGISDGKSLLEHVISLDEFPLSHAIHTNVKKLVDAKRSLFETVWRQSIPAEEMFARLELSTPTEGNTQLDPDAAKKLFFNLVTNSKYHLDMTIPTYDCLQSLFSEGLKGYLETAVNQGVKVRVLLPKDERSSKFNNNLDNPNLQVKQEEIRASRLILLADSLHSLVMDIQVTKGDNLKSIIKTAVYSTSSIALMTLSVLFEKMWT
jgi:two-component system, OmpR family, sensor histidine kinase VicK